MMFDQHLRNLLEVTVALVNATTSGHARGHPYTAPGGNALVEAIDGLLPTQGRSAGQLNPDQAAYLASTAHQMRLVFEAMNTSRTNDAAATLNALLISTGARPQLDQVGNEPWQLHFHGTNDSLEVGWSAGCASALAITIGSDLAGRLGVCTADRCDRVYIDTTRNNARQFCSTACQDRVKAAAYRARRATSR